MVRSTVRRPDCRTAALHALHDLEISVIEE